MTPSYANTEREQLQQAIAAQESLRGQVDDAIIATLKEKLAAMDSSPGQQRKLATILFTRPSQLNPCHVKNRINHNSQDNDDHQSRQQRHCQRQEG